MDMPHLPFFQFYMADWIQDTQVLTFQSKGVWIDVLCQLWLSKTPGKRTWNIREFENLLHNQDENTFDLMVTDLHRVADVVMEDSENNTVDNLELCAW